MDKLVSIVAAGFLGAAFASSAYAQQGPVEEPVQERDSITGEWGGYRTGLAEYGIEIGAAYVAEYTAVLDGGVREEGSFRNLFTFDVGLDLETVVGLEGGSVFVQYLHANAERGGSVDAGDIQAYSNISNDRSLDVIFEAWYQQVLFDERLRIKVGKLDANSEFNYVDAAGEFIHSSAGFSPTIFTFPSYPDSATSINVFATVHRTDDYDLTVGYGLYDGAAAVDGVRTGNRGPSTFFDDDRSDDYFHVLEVEAKWAALGSMPGGRSAIGGWWHTGDFMTFAGANEDGAGGFYLLAEQQVTAPHGDDSEAGLYVFGQYGWADEDVSEIAHHLAGGVVARGLVPSRPDDSAGLYVSFVALSDEPGAGFDQDETAIELYYRAMVTPAIFVQPDLQYIINPGGDASVDNALVGGVRIGIAF